MTMNEVYKALSSRIFLASRSYWEEYEPVVIFARDKEEALTIAQKHFGVSTICLEELVQTETEQVFTGNTVANQGRWCKAENKQ